jgi:hypothetical protein
LAGGVHLVVQLPQWLASVANVLSHPLDDMLLSQSPKPDLQVGTQSPAAQNRFAFAGEGQTFPHEPQFSVSSRTYFSHPSLGTVQSFHPVSQVLTHALLAQLA